MSDYSKKLKDPRWQKKRLAILQRDNWTCHRCKNTEQTLNVHHLKYFYERDPWDINDKYLVTLCESCHEHERYAKPEYISQLLDMFPELGFLSDDIELISDGLYSLVRDIKKPIEPDQLSITTINNEVTIRVENG